MPNDVVNGFSYDFSKRLYGFLFRTGEINWLASTVTYGGRAGLYEARGVVAISFNHLADQAKIVSPVVDDGGDHVIDVIKARRFMTGVGEFLKIFEFEEEETTSEVGEEIDPFEISTESLFDDGFISSRVYKALVIQDLKNLGLIVQKDERFFRNNLNNFGPVSLRKLKAMLHKKPFSDMNLCLGMRMVDGKLVRPEDVLEGAYLDLNE